MTDDMTSGQKYCLRWNNHRSNLLSVFEYLLETEAFTDVSLVAENGRVVKCHKIVLAACSSYFQSLFVTLPCQHPMIILKDVKFSELKDILEYIYRGEVNVQQDQLKNLLKIAQMLQIKGLVEYDDSIGERFSHNDFPPQEDTREASMSPSPTSTSTNVNATNMPAHSSSHMSPPQSTDSVYSNLYNKGTSSDFHQIQSQLAYWSMPLLHSRQISPRSSSIFSPTVGGNGGSTSSYDNGFNESTLPIKRKKHSNLLANHDTPILRTVLGQNHADSSVMGASMLQSNNHESMHLRSSSNGSANDNDHHRSNIDSAHNETAHSSHTDPSMDEDEKRPASQSHTTNTKSGNATHAQSKPEWKRYKQYTREDIQGAIDAVKSGISAVQAARLYNVPSRTLYDKVKKLGIPTSRPLKRSTSNGDSAVSFSFDSANVNGRLYGSGSVLSKNENENSGNINIENLSTGTSSANAYDISYKTAKDTSPGRDSIPDFARYSTSPVIRCAKQKQQQNIDDEVEDLSVNRKSDVPVIRLTSSDTIKDEPQETGPNNSDCGDYS